MARKQIIVPTLLTASKSRERFMSIANLLETTKSYSNTDDILYVRLSQHEKTCSKICSTTPEQRSV